MPSEFYSCGKKGRSEPSDFCGNDAARRDEARNLRLLLQQAAAVIGHIEITKSDER